MHWAGIWSCTSGLIFGAIDRLALFILPSHWFYIRTLRRWILFVCFVCYSAFALVYLFYFFFDRLVLSGCARRQLLEWFYFGFFFGHSIEAGSVCLAAHPDTRSWFRATDSHSKAHSSDQKWSFRMFRLCPCCGQLRWIRPILVCVAILFSLRHVWHFYLPKVKQYFWCVCLYNKIFIDKIVMFDHEYLCWEWFLVPNNAE